MTHETEPISQSLGFYHEGGLQDIAAIVNSPDASFVVSRQKLVPAQRAFLMSLVYKYPTIPQLMRSIIYRQFQKKSVPQRDGISISVQRADRALLSETGALCDGIYSSLADTHHPGMRGWQWQKFYGFDNKHQLYGTPVGADLADERCRQDLPVRSLIVQAGEYLSYIVGLTVTGWWTPTGDYFGTPSANASQEFRRKNPQQLEFEFTVYKAPKRGFSTLLTHSFSNDDNFRLHFVAREEGGIEAQIRRGVERLSPNLLMTIHRLMPEVKEFETTTLSGFTDSLGLGSCESACGSGTIGDVTFRYEFSLIKVVPDNAHWRVEGIAQPSHWEVKLSFSRDDREGRNSIGFCYTRSLQGPHHWINVVARDLQFDTIDSSVGGAETLLRDINSGWLGR